ncbi:protein geranylgeranyltransferase type II [Planoprotostelium fungivorum]|uniref:Geranylgeranyl transferase type-2 subunit alpha n=1 Tax=Planoprotostelium fungivorum TaxID=1890364 RepID=A0A2P6N7D8_9EUKA|nr:protein geranylgeranyltransferase type II [Planoprotostelium fungivorum]
MHSVRRRTAEEKEEKRIAEKAHIDKFCKLSETVMALRNNEELTKEALKTAGTLLEMNFEFYTVWNFRREIIQRLSEENSDSDALYKEELQFIQNAIMANPKSYWAWFHRKWIISRMSQPSYTKEIFLCNQLLEKDTRNFHCWGYRRWICQKMGAGEQEIFDFTTKKIEHLFSNYSAWHERSRILSTYPAQQLKGLLQSELEYVQNAFFTSPDDQSAWFYYRWLIAKFIENSTEEEASQLLETQFEPLDQLIEVEPNSRWPLNTKLYLLSKMNGRGEEMKEILVKLREVDPTHQKYPELNS